MTTPTEMTEPQFERWLSQSELDHRDGIIASNEAFIAAITREIKRGKIKVVPGTYVDTSPPIGAWRIRGDTIMSPCGSPAAMCVDLGGPN